MDLQKKEKKRMKKLKDSWLEKPEEKRFVLTLDFY